MILHEFQVFVDSNIKFFTNCQGLLGSVGDIPTVAPPAARERPVVSFASAALEKAKAKASDDTEDAGGAGAGAGGGAGKVGLHIHARFHPSPSRQHFTPHLSSTFGLHAVLSFHDSLLLVPLVQLVMTRGKKSARPCM